MWISEHDGYVVRLVAVIVFLSLARCGHPKGVVFEPVSPLLYWPQPPDPARVHYVGAIVTELDLKPAKSFGAAMKETLFGKTPVRSMLSPYALCTDGRDRLFVADSNAQLVHVFNFQTREYQQWKPGSSENSKAGAKPATNMPAFGQPVGVAWDPRGRLLVSDSVAGVIFVFDDQGKLLGEFGRDYVKRPCGVVVDSARGRVMVADTSAHQVIVLGIDGELISRLGERGTNLGQFNFPTNVAVDSLGRLYVSDSLNFRVQVFDADLKPMRQIGRQGDMPGYFSQPKGLAIDGENHVYVIDSHFEAVQVFNPEGQLLLTFGEEGQKPGQFWLPAGICIDSNERIWIADCYNRRVQVFDYRPQVNP